jgi:ATP-dependent Lon protease
MNGLLPDEIIFGEWSIRAIIRDFTREAGVRQLEREIGKICRKVATQVAEAKEEKRAVAEEAAGEETVAGDEVVVAEAEMLEPEAPEAAKQAKPVAITPEKVREYLGKPRYRFEAALRTERPGVATGLAWTPTGGEVLFVEAAAMPGADGNLILTGHLGDVMRESARIALSYVESHIKDLGLGEECCKGKIHLHVPSGAVPKDGPSAGITMVTALVSLLTGRTVYPDLGMTGEVTLQGQVLPIGGLKLKIMAAHRAGLKRVLVPKLNDVDLDELPDKIRSEVEFILVEDVNEVLAHALTPKAPEPEAEKEVKPQIEAVEVPPALETA